jgi:hypothetical protein
MAAQLKRVERGDLITSDLMNLIIDQLIELSGKGTGPQPGDVLVPSLLARTLFQASDIIKQPQISMQFGNIIDAAGNVVDPALPESKTRLIINQNPVPGMLVNLGAKVDLVLAAKATNGSSTPPVDKKPQITGFAKAETPIKQPVTILGKNFDPAAAKNKVTFDGMDAGTPSAQSTEIFLIVTVPEVSNPPAAGKTKEVTVKVETAFGEDSMKYVVSAPLSGENPKIDSIKTKVTGIAQIGEVITIQGDFFDPTPGKNKVSFEGQDVEVVPETSGSSAKALAVKVPSLPGLVGPLAPPVVGVTIVVKTTDAQGKERKSLGVGLTVAK